MKRVKVGGGICFEGFRFPFPIKKMEKNPNLLMPSSQMELLPKVQQSNVFFLYLLEVYFPKSIPLQHAVSFCLHYFPSI